MANPSCWYTMATVFELTLLDQSGDGKHKVHSHFDRSLEGPYTLKYRGRSVGVVAGGVLNKDCTDLIRRIAILIHLAEEIRNFRGENFDNFENFNEANSALSSDCVSELVAAIQAAKRLLLYPALNFHRNQKSSVTVTDGAAKKLVLQFQYVTIKLENALANLPYDHFCIPDEVEEQVDLVRAQLRRATEKYKSLSATSEIQDKKFNVEGSVKWMTNFDIKNMESTDDEATERQHCFRNLSDRIVRNSEKLMNSDLSSDGCSSGIHSVWEGDLASTSQDEIKQFDEIVIPEIFLCPISNELMRDPVTVSTGQTYERTNIQRWINIGNTTCLKTQQQLRDSTLTSNFLLRRLITKWCIEHNIQPEEGLPNPKLKKFDGSFHDVCRGTVTIETLIRKLSCGSIEEQRAAVTEIRRMSKNSTDYREQIAAAGAIPVLVNLLASDDVPIQENAMSSILNLSLYEKNKKLIMVSEAIPWIAEVLKVGSTEGRECAAATIYSLSLQGENKAIIGASGVIPDLMEILEIGSTRGKKEAARALLNLSTYNGNKDRAVQAGIIIPLLKMLSDSNDSLVDEALYIMSVFSSHPEAKAAMLKPNSMLALTNLLKTGSPRNKENAAAIFLALCKGDSEKLIWLSRLGAVVSLMDIASNGTERGRRKATSLLEQLRKSI